MNFLTFRDFPLFVRTLKILYFLYYAIQPSRRKQPPTVTKIRTHFLFSFFTFYPNNSFKSSIKKHKRKGNMAYVDLSRISKHLSFGKCSRNLSLRKLKNSPTSVMTSLCLCSPKFNGFFFFEKLQLIIHPEYCLSSKFF